MSREVKFVKKIDWLSILLYFLLVGIGWINIYSASVTDTSIGIFDMTQLYGKQLVFISTSILLIILILSVEAKFYERFSSIIYIIGLLSLLGLMVFGKNINGATSWYAIGSFTLQPSEFAKAATVLALAKFLSDIQTNINVFRDQLIAFAIILAPPVLIMLQPDAGSAMVYLAFFFVLYREGLPSFYLWIGLSLVLLFIITLKVGYIYTIIATLILGLVCIFIIFKKVLKRRRKTTLALTSLVAAIGFVLAVNYIFYNIFQQHHRDRFTLVLGLEKDPVKLEKIRKTFGFNTNQSEIAIGSGGFWGKGWQKGTRTKGDFVPEQDTDYIFTTVGEEWGFVGSSVVIFLFIALLLRILHRAEQQKNKFSRVYGYSVAAILFFHFAINIGMVIGLFPTVGIPLPFFSYGGSGLWGFTILLFIFIKLDANRINEW
ncbi:rod shape-determining protein RodA [Kordia sp. YSTF-M3]|uniref:Rod shape-determining protein RodA n=1 Tax=Kordia aestuariivivens TaxID=2759037 RepID=A0ABR7QA07_9FLAO|nr:rod shape-determining protein RodA [Kordia aestuariivivens]MBC8755402.1 rod shape-determining protein RodA [Kordia aestuariivivens]